MGDPSIRLHSAEGADSTARSQAQGIVGRLPSGGDAAQIEHEGAGSLGRSAIVGTGVYPAHGDDNNQFVFPERLGDEDAKFLSPGTGGTDLLADLQGKNIIAVSPKELSPDQLKEVEKQLEQAGQDRSQDVQGQPTGIKGFEPGVSDLPAELQGKHIIAVSPEKLSDAELEDLGKRIEQGGQGKSQDVQGQPTGKKGFEPGVSNLPAELQGKHIIAVSPEKLSKSELKDLEKRLEQAPQGFRQIR